MSEEEIYYCFISLLAVLYGEQVCCQCEIWWQLYLNNGMIKIIIWQIFSLFVFFLMLDFSGAFFTMQSLFLLQDPTMDFFRRFFIGLCAGTLSSIANIPFDVAKSRIQGPQPVPGEIKYRTCFQTMKLIYKEEGYEQNY